MLPFTEVRKNEFREKIEELVFEYAFWTSIRQLAIEFWSLEEKLWAADINLSAICI